MNKSINLLIASLIVGSAASAQNSTVPDAQQTRTREVLWFLVQIGAVKTEENGYLTVVDSKKIQDLRDSGVLTNDDAPYATICTVPK